MEQSTCKCGLNWDWAKRPGAATAASSGATATPAAKPKAALKQVQFASASKEGEATAGSTTPPADPKEEIFDLRRQIDVLKYILHTEEHEEIRTRQARLEVLLGPPEPPREVPVDAQLQRAMWAIKGLEAKVAKANRAYDALHEQRAKIVKDCEEAHEKCETLEAQLYDAKENSQKLMDGILKTAKVNKHEAEGPETAQEDWEEHYQDDFGQSTPEAQLYQQFLQLRDSLRAAAEAAKREDDNMGMDDTPAAAEQQQQAPAATGEKGTAEPAAATATAAAAAGSTPAQEQKTEDETAAAAKQAATAAAAKEAEAAHAKRVAEATQAQAEAAKQAAEAAEANAKQATASKAEAEKSAAFARRRAGQPEEPESKKAKQDVLDSYISEVIGTGSQSGGSNTGA
jgi:hypothetical protein